MLLLANVVGKVEVTNSSSCDKFFEKLPSYKKLSIKTMSYLTFDIKITFSQLTKTFIKVLIFCCFDLEYYIRIKTDTFCYAIIKS